MGLEPTTLRLRVWCSTDWASRDLLEVHSFKSSLLCSILYVHLDFPESCWAIIIYHFSKELQIKHIVLLLNKIKIRILHHFRYKWAHSICKWEKKSFQVPPRFELGSLDSKSRVLTITPWAPLIQHLSKKIIKPLFNFSLSLWNVFYCK